MGQRGGSRIARDARSRRSPGTRQRRLGLRGLAIGALALSAFAACACSSSTPYLATGSEWTKGRVRHLALVTIDGRPVHPAKAGGAALSPGTHSIEVRVEWSNASEDVTRLHFEGETGKRYVALAYELAPGEAREQALVRPLTYPRSLLRAAAGGAAEGAATLWVPIVVIYQGAKKLYGTSEPSTRPHEKCCFVWIQEEEGGAVVAGERP